MRTHLALRQNCALPLSPLGGIFKWIAVYAQIVSVKTQLYTTPQVPRVAGSGTRAATYY